MKKYLIKESTGLKKIIINKIMDIKKNGAIMPDGSVQKFKYYGFRFDAPIYKVGDVITRTSKVGESTQQVSDVCCYDASVQNVEYIKQSLNKIYYLLENPMFRGNTIYILGSNEERITSEDIKKETGWGFYVFNNYETRLVDPVVLAVFNIQQTVVDTNDRSELGFVVKNREDFSNKLLRFQKDTDSEQDYLPYYFFNQRNINPLEVYFDLKEDNGFVDIKNKLNNLLSELKKYRQKNDKDFVELIKRINKVIDIIDAKISEYKYETSIPVEYQRKFISKANKFLNFMDPRKLFIFLINSTNEDLLYRYRTIFRTEKTINNIKDASPFDQALLSFDKDSKNKKGNITDEYLKDFDFYKNYIFDSIKNNDVKKFKKALEKGIDVNQYVEGYNSLLLAAIDYKRDQIVKLLLDSGADPNLPDPYGDTPIIKAAQNNNPEIVSLLIDYGATQKEEALIAAKERYSFDVLELLLEKGIKFKNKKEYEQLLAKAFDFEIKLIHDIDNIGFIEFLLDHGVSPNIYSNNGLSLLEDAVAHDRCDLVRILLQANVNINPSDTNILDYLVDNNLDHLVK